MFTSTLTFEQFQSAALEARRAGKRVVTVVREVLGDFVTPVMAYQKLATGQGAALLESVSGGKHQGRYSIVAAIPYLKFRASNSLPEVEWLDPTFQAFSGIQEKSTAGVLTMLEKLLKSYSPSRTLPYFSGGAIGYIGHGAISIIEPTVRCHDAPDELGLPDISLMFCEQVLVFDHHTQSLSLILNVPIHEEMNEEALYNGSLERLRQLECAVSASRPNGNTLTECPVHVSSNFTQQGFETMVGKAKEHIAAGDVFQVVLSQRFETPFPASRSLDFYRLLRRANPSPYLFHLDFGTSTQHGKSFCLVGASPEVMVRVQNREILIRPLAGTRRRGADTDEDKAIAQELAGDFKEQAEHRMLVDLARNDVGKFSEAGSVRVEDLMRVEPYGAVLHMATDVRGKLREEVSSFEALLGSLPAGTLSGAPKIRALQLISEIEPCQRGPYGGAVGWFTDNNIDTCIMIRSAIIANDKLYWQAGAGIVADSIPASEYQETLAKSASIQRVLMQMGGKG